MKAAVVLSCLISVFISVPLWLFLTYSILSALGDGVSGAAWAAYYMYIPTVFFQVVIASIVRLMEKENE